MKPTLLAASVIAAMGFAGSTATAGGVNLAWNNCASEGGTANRSSTCDSNSGADVLTGSFVPAADIAGVTGVEIVLDVIVGDGISTIPPWWDMGSGGCRGGAITANGFGNAANTICTDWASGAASGGLAAYTGGDYHINPANQPAVRLMVLGFAVAPVDSANLFSTQEYFAFNVRIGNASTIGTPSCAGCTAPACIVLNSINVVAGATQQQRLDTGTTAGSNFATWRGVGPSCQLVPTKRATWGAVKALYR
jgi:hypothetical protein